MFTIHQAVSQIVSQSPIIQEMLRSDLLNLSSYAKLITPEVVKLTWKIPTNPSIVMALSRLKTTIRSTFDISFVANDISLKYPLIEINYTKQSNHTQKIATLYDHLKEFENTFLNIVTGNTETTVFVNSKYIGAVSHCFSPHKPNFIMDELGAISLKFDQEYLEVSGITYLVLKELLWNDINLIEVVSTYTEITLIIEMKNIQRTIEIMSQRFLPQPA